MFPVITEKAFFSRVEHNGGEARFFRKIHGAVCDRDAKAPSAKLGIHGNGIDVRTFFSCIAVNKLSCGHNVCCPGKLSVGIFNGC